MASVAVGRTLVFHSFRSILDPIHPCRPYKRRGNMWKNPQLEKKGFKVLKSTRVDHNPKDRYENILSDRSLKSSRWFFSSFRSVLDQNTNLYEKKTYRRMLNWKETDFKVLKSKMTTVPTIDVEIICCAAWTTLILVQVDFRVSNCLPYDCMLHIFWQLVLNNTISLDLTSTSDFILSSKNFIKLLNISFFPQVAYLIWPYFTRLATYLPLSKVFAEFIWHDLSFCHAITLWAISLQGRESLFFIPFAALQPAQALPNKTARFAK